MPQRGFKSQMEFIRITVLNALNQRCAPFQPSHVFDTLFGLPALDIKQWGIKERNGQGQGEGGRKIGLVPNANIPL